MIEAKIEYQPFLKAARRAADQMADTRPLMRSIAGIMFGAVEDNLEQQGRPRWQDLHPGTKAARAKQGTWPGKILQRSGGLAASIQQSFDATHSVVGTNKVYAAIQNFGGKTRPHVIRAKTKRALSFGGIVVRQVNHPGSNIPARPFLALSDKSNAARSIADNSLIRRIEDAQSGALLRISVLKDAFGQAKNALSNLLDTSALRVVLSDLDPVLYPLSYVADLFSVVDRALQGLPFGGRNILFDPSSGNSLVSGSGLSDFNTVSQTIAPSKIAIVPNALAPDATMLADVAIVQAHAQVHAACAVADALTILFAAEMDTPLMDRSDIEAVTNVTRAGLQTAIDGTRGAMDAEGRGQVAEALREVASAVQEAAQAVINQRPPVVSKPCPISGPVRLVAHQMYGDATRADEISRLNSLGRNVLLQRGDALHVYSI